jgi:hypothetical protein
MSISYQRVHRASGEWNRARALARAARLYQTDFSDSDALGEFADYDAMA